jgi:hypothetical protein
MQLVTVAGRWVITLDESYEPTEFPASSPEIDLGRAALIK